MLDLHANNDYILIIPPRCEVIRYVHTGLETECIIIPNEVCQGVFAAGIMVQPIKGKVPVKFLNTRESEVRLRNFCPRTKVLNDYNYCHFNSQENSAVRVKELFNMLKLNYLNKEEQNSIEKICAKFADVFHLPGDKLTVTNLYKQSIHIKPNTQATYKKPYRLPQVHKEEINRQISQMLKDDIIESAQSEWSSPVLLVPKKNGVSSEKRARLVLDYRSLNESLVDTQFPIPNVVEILDSLAGALYFSHLDLSQGYYQVELDEESRKYTAFTTDKGQWQMKRLPMGLKISPRAFSRLMTIAMAGLTYEKCFVYLDDLIVFGRNLREHNKNLMDVLLRLRTVNLKLNPSKCEFLKKEILYLGHIISSEGISPDPGKIVALKEYPVPKNVDETKRFVAFANYYRKFISNFSELATPLNKLCKKYARFDWTNECNEAFNSLKKALIEHPVLDYPDFSDDNEFILQTDASNFAIGAVLSNKSNKPVAYASRSLNKAELNYPVIHKELAAICWAVKYFRPYLYGRRFKILTDHRPLIYLFGLNDPGSRLTKFRLCLEEYDFYIEFIKGKNNVTADALSRVILTSDELKTMNDNIIQVITRGQRKRREAQDCALVENDNEGNWPDQPVIVEILKQPKNCVELLPTQMSEIKPFLKDVTESSGNFYYVPLQLTLYLNQSTRSTLARDEMLRDLVELSKKANLKELYIVKNASNKEFIKILGNEIKKCNNWRGPRINIVQGVRKIMDNDEKRVILNDFHLLPTSGHAGINRMTNNIKKYYVWPGLDSDVRNFVKRCEACQKQKHSNHYTKEPMTITSTAESAFQKIYLDIVGPLPSDINGFVYILTLQCELSKYVEAYPLKNKDAVSVAKALVENFILRYGIPQEIATDRGSEFISSTMTETCKLLGIKQIHATAYHHESIGALENSHKVLGAYLRMQTQSHDAAWSSWIPYWCFTYNTTIHTETKYSPFELVFGRKCHIPNNLNNDVEPIYNFDNYPVELKYRLQKAHEEARNSLLLSKTKRKQKLDEKVNPVHYSKGDMILVKNESGDKISSPCFLGPYEVVEDVSPNVKIIKDKKHMVIHKNRTKLFYS